jgi:hypothetical protein
MSNTEWKNGYDAGFAAGWKAAKSELPGVYNITSGASFTTMNDQPYNIKTNVELGTIVLKEEKKKPDLKVIHNLTDHTRIV